MRDADRDEPGRGHERVPFFMREPGERPAGQEATQPLALVVLIGLLGLLWARAGSGALIFVVGLIVMIFLHELGHFLTARWTGMKVTQFFLGFGPRLWSFRRGEVEYGLRAVPAGAFVRIVGMNNLDPVDDPADAPRAYMNASYPRRMLVITAGSIMHFLQALLIFAVVFTASEIVDFEGAWTIDELAEVGEGESPAIVAGLAVGDRVLAIDGIETASFQDLRSEIEPRAGETVVLDVLRASGEREAIELTLAGVDDGRGGIKGFLGVGAGYDEVFGPLDAPAYTLRQMQAAVAVIPRVFSPQSLADLGSLMFRGAEEVDITSSEAEERPISMVGAVRLAGDDDVDWVGRLMLLAAINVFVGLVNLVPLLPLDGGHAAIATYERIRSGITRRRHQADVAKLMPLTYAVVALLGFIFVSTVWLDILRPIS